MTHIVLFMFIFVAIAAVSIAVFGMWIFFFVFRVLFRGLSSLFRLAAPPARPSANVCPRATCRTVNPHAARFCRRCGYALLAIPRAHRRAALW